MPFWGEKSEKDKYLSEGKKAKRAGDYQRAGDYFFMAGAVDEALEMYVQGGHHQLAAQMLEKKGDLRRAAELYVQARDMRAAATIYQKLGDGKRASQMYEKIGEYFKAAQLEESTAPRRAAELYLKAGQLEKAAHNYAKDGSHLRAAETLEESLLKTPSTDKDHVARQWAVTADQYQRARRFAKAGEIWARLNEWRKAAEAFEWGQDHARAVEMFLKAGDGDRAYDIFRRAPDGTIERRTMADLLYMRGSWREAAELFRALDEHQKAAECYEKAGESALAAQEYERGGDLEVAGDLLYAAGEFSRASRAYEKALRHIMAARAADEAGEAERAAELYVQAREPLDAAKCWRKVGQLDKAIGLLQQIAPTHEGYIESCILLGDLFREKGLGSIAFEKYRAAIGNRGVDESTIEAYYGQALLHEEKSEVDKALELLERIVATSYTFRDAASRLEGLRKRRSQDVTPARPFVAASLAAMPAAGGGSGDVESTQGVLASSGPVGVTTGSTSAVIARRYEIVARIGRSTRGEVYKAWDSSLGRTVVLKQLAAADETDAGQVRRYVQEAQQASKLHHSNIATIYDAVESPEGKFVATEYVFGESLREILSHDGKLTPARAVEIVSQVLLALEYAHSQGVAHRNLRPENVLVSEKTHVKLTDFGMNRRYADLAKEPYREGGPVHYLSPEQIRGEKVDPRSDIYAAGCILYEMLTGRPPFTGPDTADKHLTGAPVPPSQLDTQIPASLDKVVLRALEKDPARRHGTAHQAYEELRAFDFMPGLRIGDRYELLRELGVGGMGKVYLARDLELDETLAMKVLRPEFGTDTMLEQRFIREIKLARRIVHPSVVKVYDFGKWKNIKYITMEYIDGMSLEEYVRRNKPTNVREVSRFVIQICDALDAAHRLGVIHRDIKPQNVLISTDKRAKLVDFGIARIEQFEDLTSSRLIIGSPKYMSPEQITGKNIDHRTDLYSLGVVMYYCYTGIEPFTADDTNGIILKQLHEMPAPPCQVTPDLPPWVDLVVLKALVKDPAGRYQRALDIARELQEHVK